MALENCEPKSVFKYFEEICGIPHGSGNEQEISDYLVAFAKERGLWVHQDKWLNVIIKKPGTAGYEKAPAVILQGHMDMVCEKNNDTVHDFLKDPLKLVVDGDFLRADGTTLGADNGIAVAMGLALLDADDIPHPPIELLITTNEEVGMTGAEHIDPSLLDARILINLDSEKEGFFLTSCAGGMRAVLTVGVEFMDIPKDFVSCELSVKGLKGGHSGADIHKERANSNRILSRALNHLRFDYELYLAHIEGGAKENAIPREAKCKLAVRKSDFANMQAVVTELEKTLRSEYRVSDENITLQLAEISQVLERVFTLESSDKVIAGGTVLPNGVQSMSMDIEDLVETSCNNGVVRTDENSVRFAYSLRSSVVSRKYYMVERMRLAAKTLGAEFEVSGDYPAWEYNPDSKLVEIFKEEYEKFTGKTPKIEAIHAGVECGLFAKLLRNPDMISMGPTMHGAHTPDECVSISSVLNLWNFLKHILGTMK